mmetsp:Transcript_37794/g.95816  ORF Transcript_37794/g.95816 Transcript_37794/m.95816 type:complete len:605 (+) Transcript_37794:32-1846(+)
MDLSGGAGYLLLGTLLVGTLSSLALLHFAQREVSWSAFITTWLGFVLSFGIIALVPYDVSATLAGEEVQPSENVVGSSWELIYWATFVLCWVLCPLFIEYEAAGGFTTYGRFRASLRRNAYWCLGYLAVGMILLVWLSMDGRIGLRAWCIAASNAWGLFLLTVLMGHGLVAVPRHLWRLANPAEQLAILYCSAVTMDEARLSTQFELQDLISEARGEIRIRSAQVGDPSLERAFEILQLTLEECELLHCELTNGARGVREGGQGCGNRPVGGEDASKLDALAEMFRALKLAALEARRAACRWNEMVRRCLMLEDLEEHLYPSAVELSTYWEGSCLHLCCRVPAVRSAWHAVVSTWLKKLRAPVLRVSAVFCGCLSAVIVLGQLTMFSKSTSLSALSLLFQTGHGFWVTQVCCMVPLSYMVCTAYWSVFRLKIAGWYGLYSDHNTDASSLLWCASTLARLAAPLCYHFLFLIRVKNTAFQEMMGQMNVVPVLGGSFNEVFPVLVGFICLCNLLNVYSRMVQLFGLEALEIETVPLAPAGDTNDLLQEGRRLIERERRRRSEDRNLLEMVDRSGESGRTTMPLRFQIQALIEDGTLPLDWNAASPP